MKLDLSVTLKKLLLALFPYILLHLLLSVLSWFSGICIQDGIIQSGKYPHPFDLNCPTNTVSEAIIGWVLYFGFFVLNYIVLSTQTVRKNVLYYFLYLVLLPFVVPILLMILSIKLYRFVS